MAGSLNGKTGEWVRFGFALVAAAVVSYFTAIGSISERVTEVKATEDAHFQEVLRRLSVIQDDVRELRGRPAVRIEADPAPPPRTPRFGPQ